MELSAGIYGRAMTRANTLTQQLPFYFLIF